MDSQTPASPLVMSVVLLAGVLVVLLAMRTASDILSPILLAMVLAISIGFPAVTLGALALYAVAVASFLSVGPPRACVGRSDRGEQRIKAA